MLKTNRSKLVPRAGANKDALLHVVASEGKTEALYFDRLFDANKKVRVRVLPPNEETNLSAPQYVLARLDQVREQFDIGGNDTLWLMVDLDRWPVPQLSDVCREAVQKSIWLALSNPCFELWLLLHFGEADPADTDPKAVGKRIETLCGGLGQGKTFLDPERYRPFIAEAVERARALDTDPDARWPAFLGTHVYKIVERL